MATDTLKAAITEDMKTAMREKNSRKLTVIRLILAAIKQKEVDERITLDDAQTLAIIDNMIKQRKGSIAEFTKADRQDLIDIEEYEIGIIQHYLPEQLSETEVDSLIKQAMEDTQAESMKDMGKVMAILKPQLQGRADIAQVSAQVKALLS